MGLTLVVESCVLSIFGWVWLAVQNIWLPSLLCSYAYYSFLILSTFNLALSALLTDARGPRVAYFNTVLALTIFLVSCTADTIPSYTFGGEEFRPPTKTTGCCANCDIARANQVLFFMDSPLYLVQAGILSGYLVVQLFLAGGQMLDLDYRSVWGGAGWSSILAVMMASRFIIMFDGSTMTLVPESVFYVLLFSQPLMTISVVYWLFLTALLILMVVEGMPQITIMALRIVRSVQLGVIAGFSVVSGVVFGMRGMLTVPLFLTLCVLTLSSLFALLEAFLGRPASDEQTVGRNQSVSRSSGHLAPASSSVHVAQRSRAHIPVSVQMSVGKKGV